MEGNYDGIGAKDFDAVGGSVKISVPLNQGDFCQGLTKTLSRFVRGA